MLITIELYHKDSPEGRAFMLTRTIDFPLTLAGKKIGYISKRYYSRGDMILLDLEIIDGKTAESIKSKNPMKAFSRSERRRLDVQEAERERG